MHWVWEPEALAGAVRLAGTSPLVQRALAAAPIEGLRARHDLAIRAVGDGSDGAPVGFTILPYSVAGDPTRAAFVSMVQGFGREAAEFAEMIVGREPRPDEVGFHSVVWGDRIVWIRSGEAYAVSSSGANRSPMKRQWTKFFDCLAQRMPTGCAAGSAIAEEIAPGEPRAAAIGCGLGAAAGAGSCIADFVRDR
jgi:hypothetical protein